ncbi:AcrR family transcriptional regulator [Thermocatellispora tengchongensis]|uniref:AcrR family transcriptional regulator n=1 Tax=Thermocatellispora tengchongensis TaxID=1073253 RepID=A0A840P6E0_9ACTN|nr:TetR/AcrR family transcriptional regulator [Thermocatellispora tengchongensis]MBB5133030.1 AcrR family transcriptional regulator [Thermocatellispora tengchongensis]
MNASRTARERVRAELIREITDIARRHLATEGAAGLSLRAVAREMGMVSSAIYRYFPSRDDLLTALIIDGYNAIGEAVEQAEATCPRDDYLARWLACCRAVRTWALNHPHEYALLYGSPVPGYHAPTDTVPAAIRDTVVYGRIISDAHHAGALTPPELGPQPPAVFTEDADRLREIIPGVPDDLVARAVTAWTTLFGMVNFELFGQFNNAIYARDALFDHTMTRMAAFIGIPGTTTA